MTRIYLARHGETEWNAVGKLQGATDVPLNETGRSQAQALGERLASEGIGRVFTSDLSRARETGQIAANALEITNVQMDAELRERSFGVFEGLTRTELETQHAEAWRAWQDSAIAPPGAEPSDLVAARMKRALTRIFALVDSPRAPTLVVSHGGAMRLLLNDLINLPVPPIGNGAVYEIETADTLWAVQAWPRRT